MRRTSAFASVLVFAAMLRPEVAAAANKEHQQLMAEIRMLQEQQLQLQQLLGGLGDSLKAINARLDTDAGRAQKAFADQKLVLEGVAETARILREKADDTNVRLSTMTQEIQALRQTVSSLPPSASAAPATAGTEPPNPSAQPGQPATPATTGSQTPPPNISPQRMYDQAYADYTVGQWELAIEGFQAFIRTFPTSPNADDAQLNIGNSLYGWGKFQEAVAAYQKVISDYPQSDSVPPAYYKLGLTYDRLHQPDLARKAFETVIKNHPGSYDAILAKQRLDSLSPKK